MNAIRRHRKLVVVLATVAVASVLIGAVRYTPVAAPESRPAPVAAVGTPMVGVATGEFANGVPVYRLPSVAVVESRSEALARFAREDALARK
ncbi:MAG: hypothetical protein U1F15_07850 [Burkholderiales bacterium]